MSNLASAFARSTLSLAALAVASIGVACAPPDAAHLHTVVAIDAPAEVVWDLLVDFEGHRDWDPFFTKLEGDLTPGETLDIVIGDPADGGMAFTPEVLVVDEDRELRWIGRLVLPGVFDGEHVFRLEPQEHGGVLLTHEEFFTGPVVPFFWEQLDTETRAGFEEFNAALKERAEADLGE
jgi:hypothetical protein